MTAQLVILPAAVAAIARVRAEARAAVTDLSLPATRHALAWMVMRGARNPKARMNQPNLGAAVASPEWPMSAVVIESGAAPWGANDAG
jgi:hypothetical protein